jgi:hypothetical protein
MTRMVNRTSILTLRKVGRFGCLCINRARGAANHLPNGTGLPLCNTPINRSVWQIEECPITTTVICHCCRVVLAKLARS